MAIATGGYYSYAASGTDTHDVKTDLGIEATEGFIHNYGSGTIVYRLSENGTDYGSNITLPAGAIHNFGDYDITQKASRRAKIAKIDIATNGSSSTYMIFVR